MLSPRMLPAPGILPPSLSSLASLINFDASGCNLTGTLPPSYQNMSSLQALGLASNQLTGELPESYSALEALTHIDLSLNGFTGRAPPEWAPLTNLVYLSLAHNTLTGEGAALALQACLDVEGGMWWHKMLCIAALDQGPDTVRALHRVPQP